MITCYKLTDHNHETRNNTKWGENVTHSLTPCTNPALCSGTVLHYYRSIEMAMILNPEHANIDDPVLWEAEAGGEVVSDYGKAGCFSLTTKKIIRYSVTPEQLTQIRRRFAILCAEAVLHYFESKFPNDDRPRKAIEAAKKCLVDPSAAAWAAAAGAADAAARAAAAAREAAWAEGQFSALMAWAEAEAAAYAAAGAADAAAWAASGAGAADAAARAEDKIDFDWLAKQAWREEFQK